MQKIIVAIVVVLGVTNAYDFSDELYNNILTRELQKLLPVDNANVRVRRDQQAAKCQTKHPLSGLKSCCSNDVVDNYHQSDRPIMAECRNEIYGKQNISGQPQQCGNAQANRELYLCLAQCVGQKQGYLDSDGKLLPEKLKDNIKQKLSPIVWLRPLLDDMLNKCIAEVEAANENAAAGAGKCKPGASTIGHCVWRELQLGCPAEEITDVENCKKVRNYISGKPQID